MQEAWILKLLNYQNQRSFPYAQKYIFNWKLKFKTNNQCLALAWIKSIKASDSIELMVGQKNKEVTERNRQVKKYYVFYASRHLGIHVILIDTYLFLLYSYVNRKRGPQYSLTQLFLCRHKQSDDWSYKWVLWSKTSKKDMTVLLRCDVA